MVSMKADIAKMKKKEKKKYQFLSLSKIGEA
jgi:hypothetical protein